MNRLTHQVLRPLPHRYITVATRQVSTSVSNPNRKQRRQQPTLNANPDWRDLFRSAEYDNAWSPYIPFVGSQSGSTQPTSSTQQDTVQALVDGKWQKRRHGMNLVPLSMRLKEAVSADDVEIKLNEGRLRWLDSQTRFLCSMLDDLYRTGIRRQIDRARTERCHRIIGKLLTLTPPLTSEEYSKLPFNFSGLAQRAASIVDKMERCSPVALQHVNPDQINTDGMQISKRAGSIRLPQHLPHTKHELPYPTPQIYNMVLLLHAKESGPAYIAQQAEDVIWSMIERVMQQKELNTNTQVHHILPSKENWDCVVRCWSKNTDSDRAYHAHSFIASWNMWNDHIKRQNTIEVDTPEPDMASYHLLLECCLADVKDTGSVEIGSKIAIQFWDDKKQSALSHDFDSETYFLLLRSICQISEVSRRAKNPSYSLTKAIFNECCEKGLLTAEIIDVVRKAISDREFKQLIGSDEKTVDKDGNMLSSDELIRRVPSHWIMHGL